MTELGSATSPSVANASTVLVPLGSVEQHGPHLPLLTDTIIASAVATAVAGRLREPWTDVFVAPALPYGSSGEHQSFAGTSSIGTSILADLLVEMVRSMRHWADSIVFVNGHGGNVDALIDAVGTLRGQHHRVGWVSCSHRGGDLHAGHTETSLVMYLAPWLVRKHHAEPGNPQPLAEILPVMRVSGIAGVSPNGVLGDPTQASAEAGGAIFDDLVDDLTRRIGDWNVDERLGLLVGSTHG